MAVPLKVIIFLLYLSIPCTNKMETSGQRQDNLLRSYFIPYTSFMPNWFADPPKDRLPYVINAENMKISFLLPINSHLEWLLTTKLFGSTLTDDWSLLFSVEIGQKQEDLSFSKFLMNNKVCQGNTNSVPSHPQKHSKKKKSLYNSFIKDIIKCSKNSKKFLTSPIFWNYTDISLKGILDSNSDMAPNFWQRNQVKFHFHMLTLTSSWMWGKHIILLPFTNMGVH